MNILYIAILIPFLYFIPGFFIVKAFFSSLDQVETIVLSALFSLMLSHIGIYALEETTKKMSITDIAIVIAVINILCAIAYIARQKQLSPARLLTRLRNKFYKGDQK